MITLTPGEVQELSNRVNDFGQYGNYKRAYEYLWDVVARNSSLCGNTGDVAITEVCPALACGLRLVWWSLYV